MKILKTTDLGGHPKKYVDEEFLQEMIRDLSKGMFGFAPTNKVMVLNGTISVTGSYPYPSRLQTTEMYVWYNNELFYMPVQDTSSPGASYSPFWVINEYNDERGAKVFEDDTTKNVFTVREMSIDWVDYPYNNMLVENYTVNLFDYVGGCPLGAILMWSGNDENNVPDGWAICDGRVAEGYQTPDLRDRMIRGASLSDAPPLNDPGNLSEGGINTPSIGGSYTITITQDNLPSHSHSAGALSIGNGNMNLTIDYDYASYNIKSGNERRFYGEGTSFNDGPGSAGINNQSHSHSISGNTGNTGGGTSITHFPKFSILLFIMRVK